MIVYVCSLLLTVHCLRAELEADHAGFPQAFWPARMPTHHGHCNIIMLNPTSAPEKR